MRKLDRRGVAAFEFCLVAAVFFMFVFAIFDLGRYAITMQSLRLLANTGARAMMTNDCYVTSAINKTTPSCSGDPLSKDTKQNTAPFLYAGGLTPTVSTTVNTTTSTITVTASQPAFTMLMPIFWGITLNGPSASTQVSF